MSFSLILQQAFNGISLASILLLAALGLAFSFGLMKVINMAHGEFIMVGAYVTYIFQKYVAVAIGGANRAEDGVGFILFFLAPFFITATLGLLLVMTVGRHLVGPPLGTPLATRGGALLR